MEQEDVAPEEEDVADPEGMLRPPGARDCKLEKKEEVALHRPDAFFLLVVAGISCIVGVLIPLASTNEESEGAFPCH